MAASSPASTAERQELIERYVHLDALSIFVGNLGSTAGGDPNDPPLEDLPELDKLLQEAGVRISGEEFYALYPDGDGPDADSQVLHARTELLVARIFALLASRPDFLAERAAYFTEIAERKLHTVEGADDA